MRGIVFMMSLLFIAEEASSMRFGVPSEPSESSEISKRSLELRNRFIRGESISEKENTESLDDTSIDILKELQKNSSWTPGPSVDDATKQRVANTINQKVLRLISQKELEKAKNWVDVQKRFTHDKESVSRNKLLIMKAEAALSKKEASSGVASSFPFLTFYTGQ